jgi:hypothetical protein
MVAAVSTLRPFQPGKGAVPVVTAWTARWKRSATASLFGTPGAVSAQVPSKTKPTGLLAWPSSVAAMA